MSGGDDDPNSYADEQDLERLPCSWKYVVICILLPGLSGLLNALLFPAYSLHFEEMEWPLIRAGMAVTIGFVSRVLVQQMILRAGYWLAVPLCMIHLTFAILALIFTTSEWAVFAQIVCVFGIDPTCAIEGIAFDAFGASEVQARQATSTSLSVYTIAIALSCTIGGLIYDTFGWTGLAAFHSGCEGLLAVMLFAQPACRHSFIQVFFKDGDAADVESMESSTLENGVASEERVFTHVVPGTAEPKIQLPGATEELQVEEVEGNPSSAIQSEARRSGSVEKAAHREQQSNADSTTRRSNADGAARRSNADSAARRSNASTGARRTRNSNLERRSRRSNLSRRSGASYRSNATRITAKSKNSEASRNTGGSRSTGGTGKTDSSGGSGGTGNSTWTYATRQTAATIRTAFSRITALSQAGEDFRHHFGTSNVLMPEIVGATGRERIARDEIDEDENKVADKTASRTGIGAIPKDVRLPALLIALTAFFNNASYAMEFATFAIYFKQEHNWNEATLASIAQTSGDLVAAVAMQVIPALFNGAYDPDEAGCVRRFFHNITSLPYNLSFGLATWILFNMGMMSPVLALAIVAQVFMGTTFVYCSKWYTDMNLFYSLGDSTVFMSLQVICRNAEALGGGLAGILGTFLYTINPVAPFVFTTGMACLMFVLYTVGFCIRLGYGDEIETAEEKRARRRGVRRVSSWAADARNTKILTVET